MAVLESANESILWQDSDQSEDDIEVSASILTNHRAAFESVTAVVFISSNLINCDGL